MNIYESDTATDTEVKYEMMTVRAIRGMESRAVAKWETDGWELVSQTPGKLRTELTFRRPKPKTRRIFGAVGGAVLAIVLIVFVIIGIVEERNAAPAETPSAAVSESGVTPSASPSTVVPTVEPSAAPQDVVLTPDNNTDLAALIALTDYCDPSIAIFAEKYSGQTIAFPGNISAMGPHDGATTRFDILIGADAYSETSAPGPAFQFRDVNTVSDLHYVGVTPDSIGVGTNLNVTAQVDEYEAKSCLFLLEPVSTSFQ